MAEATVFTDAERAALELAEQGTRIADGAGGVSDEAWANATKHYDEDQLAALISLIAASTPTTASTSSTGSPPATRPGKFSMTATAGPGEPARAAAVVEVVSANGGNG